MPYFYDATPTSDGGVNPRPRFSCVSGGHMRPPAVDVPPMTPSSTSRQATIIFLTPHSH